MGNAKPSPKASGKASLKNQRRESAEPDVAPERPAKRPEPADSEARPKEKILDEDRKNLEEILKRK